MNEFERKRYLKYRNIENMTQLLCLKLSTKTFYASKRTSFFTFFPFFKCTSGLHKKNLSNQLSNSSTNFGLGIKQPSSRQSSNLLIKKILCK